MRSKSSSDTKGSPPATPNWLGRIYNEDGQSIILAACFIATFAVFAFKVSAQEMQALRLVQTIPLPGVKGRLDHMAVDLEKKRAFVAAVTNNSLEVVDLASGKVIKSLTGFNNT